MLANIFDLIRSLYVYFEGNLDSAKKIQRYDVIMTSDYVIMSIKLCPEVVLCVILVDLG